MRSGVPGIGSGAERTSSRTALARVVVVALVAGSLAAPAAGTAAAADGSVLVVQPTVSPAQPTTAENFTVTVRVTNVGETNDDFYFVESVAVRNGSEESSTLYGRTDDRLVIEPGRTRGQPVEVDVDEAGNRTLYVHTTIRTGPEETVTVVRPLSVVVRDRHPSMSLTASRVDPDGETRLNLTVANSLDTAVRGLTLDLSATNTDVRNGRRVAASLAPGESRTFQFTGTETIAGPQTATVDLSYTTADGDRRVVTRRLSAFAAEPSGTVPSVDVSAAPVGVSGETTLSVTVVNPHRSAIRGAAVELQSDSVELTDAREVRARIGGGSAATYTFETGNVTPGEKTVTAVLTYATAAGTDRRVTETLSVNLERVDNPGKVSLTGLRVSRQGDLVTVRGSASNVGSTNVTGVVVSVADGEAVGPAQSESRFFVGNIPGGDFTSFEVQGRLRTANASRVTIPVRVSYVTDGVRVERVVEVPYEPAPARPDGEGSGGGSPLVLVGGLAVVGVGAVLAWRRFRG